VAAERGGAAAERGERAEHGRGARRPTRGRGGRRREGAEEGRWHGKDAGGGDGEEEREAVHVDGQRRSEAFWTSSDSLK